MIDASKVEDICAQFENYKGGEVYLENEVYSISVEWIRCVLMPGWIQIKSFYVKPQYRNMGYGKAFAEYLYSCEKKVKIVSVLSRHMEHILLKGGWHREGPPNAYNFRNYKDL